MSGFGYKTGSFQNSCGCLFSIVYDPPEDGVWGALEASGNMSGLIGQAAYNEVDMSLSGIMITR